MKAVGRESSYEWCYGWMLSVKRKDRLRVRLEVVPHFHSHSSSGAHALSVTVTSVPPLHSCTRLWRRSALLSFIRGHAISVFPSGRRAELTWNDCGAASGGGGGGGSTAMFGCIRAHQISDHARVVIALSHAQPSPCRLNNFIFFQQGKWRPQWSHFLWLLRRSSQKQRERWWIVVIKTLTTIRKVWSHCEVRAALTLQFQRLHSTHISSFFKLQSENYLIFFNFPLKFVIHGHEFERKTVLPNQHFGSVPTLWIVQDSIVRRKTV